MSDAPDEMSMNEVLSSIRQMLSDGGDVVDEEPVDSELEDIFVLTPAMRISDEKVLSIQEKMKLALNKLAEQRPRTTPEAYRALIREELQPVLKEWLMQKMPEMVEQAVEKEIDKLFK